MDTDQTAAQLNALDLTAKTADASDPNAHLAAGVASTETEPQSTADADAVAASDGDSAHDDDDEDSKDESKAAVNTEIMDRLLEECFFFALKNR